MVVLSVDRPLRFASAAAFVVLALLSPRLALAVDETSEGEAILVYEKSIKSRLPPGSSVAWSPDNRQLAVGFADGKLHVLDSNDGTDRVILSDIGGASFAWSADGRTMAVHQSVLPHGFRLLSVADAHEIGRWSVTQTELNDGRCPSTNMPMMFTDDGKALWVTCRTSVRHVPVTFPIAVKHRLPDLSVEDRIELKTPIDGKAAVTHYSLGRFGGNQSLTALIGYHIPGKLRYFAYAFDLERKTELFPNFEAADDNRSGLSRPPQQVILLPDGTFALIHLAPWTYMKTGTVPDYTFDRLFEGYDTHTGQRTVAYGGPSGAIPEAGVILEAALLPDGRSVVGLWSRAATREGGLVVFDARSGAVRQRIRFGQTFQLALSPNGRRAATITAQGELRIYRVNN
jgi:WD40 repeat protein